jgi:hypothetical protein
MTIFLPLGIGSTWQDNETRYLLRSLEQNFKEPFDVMCYCQDKPDWLDINHKIIERYYPERLLEINRWSRRYENYFDVLNKVYQFVNSKECPETFVYIYDDVLLIKEITSEEIRNLPQCQYTKKMFAIYQGTRYGKTINQAYILSNAEHNFEHHLPLIYNRNHLKEMFNKFPFQEMNIPYSLATLYFNLYKDEIIYAPLNFTNNYKAGFEGFSDRICTFKQDTIKDIELAIEGKTWVNYNDTGLFWHTPNYIGFPLQDWILKTFPNKSRYEI